MQFASNAPSSEAVVARDRRFVVQNYRRNELVIDRAEGVYLFGNDGRRYLDFLSGIGVMALGHANPRIVKAVADQLRSLGHCSNLYYHPLQGQAAERLAALSGLRRTFFCNSGAEAVETALKIAKGHGRSRSDGKQEIVALKGSLGGRTLGATSVTGQARYTAAFAPLLPGVRFIEPNDLGALEATVSERTAAILFEPVLGEGGIVEISPAFAWLARHLASDFNALLICDEVQSGLGRTGDTFAFQRWGLDFKPDAITLAKPLAAGLPIGAVVCSESAASVLGPGLHASTFGGGALACRAAIEFLDMLPGLLPHVREVGGHLAASLADLARRHGLVRGVRGRGLMLGLELAVAGAAYVARAQERGLLINCTAGTVLRFLPPYVITRDHADEAVAILNDVLGGGPVATMNAR